ncbi:MAG: N-acetylmuramic acid 6-phosphate etherase [Planctomycetota bacterium]|nr:N-acetylmuramic acid 6-phosphate etherase [Planctomycetota bacterium]
MVSHQPQHPTPDRGHLATEQTHPDASGLDQLSTNDALALFTAADRDAVAAVEAAREDLERAVDCVAEKLRDGGRFVQIGAGTSGRLAVLDASECPPTFCSDPETVQGVIAGGATALTHAVEGAEDSREEGAASVDERQLGPADVLLGISAGGTTPFVHAALEQARKRGATTIFMTSVPADQVPDPADVTIRLLTGPELVAGSTRLKAGTATKMALNALSTLVMVRLGKVHGNLMVDVDTSTNAKLVERGTRILMELLDCSREEAGQALQAAQGRVKVAAVMGRLGVDREAALIRLAKSGDSLRRVLEET